MGIFDGKFVHGIFKLFNDEEKWQLSCLQFTTFDSTQMIMLIFYSQATFAIHLNQSGKCFNFVSIYVSFVCGVKRSATPCWFTHKQILFKKFSQVWSKEKMLTLICIAHVDKLFNGEILMAKSCECNAINHRRIETMWKPINPFMRLSWKRLTSKGIILTWALNFWATRFSNVTCLLN